MQDESFARLRRERQALQALRFNARTRGDLRTVRLCNLEERRLNHEIRRRFPQNPQS